MSKINGDKARQNIQDRRSLSRRERMRPLAKAAQAARQRIADRKKTG